MKWNKTVASECRYGDVAAGLFGDSDVIWEHSDADYQGYANVLGALPDGTFIHYEWSYGSCSGCDEWEDRGLTDEQILAEMRRVAVVLDKVGILKYLHLDETFVKGSGEIGDDFRSMATAFEEWLKEQHE